MYTHEASVALNREAIEDLADARLNEIEVLHIRTYLDLESPSGRTSYYHLLFHVISCEDKLDKALKSQYYSIIMG